MFELTSHRSSFNIENLRYTSQAHRLTTLQEFLKQRQKLLYRNRSFITKPQSNRTSAVDPNDTKAFYQIASLVPDEVVYNSENTKIRSFDAAVLLADISGFTALSDKYQNVENGASKLSMVLNFYLGIMVQEILSHNGDIIKYAGDAFLATFRHDKNMSMQNSVQNAIDTAIIIQSNCQDYVSEIGVVLNVKIAISCGQVDFSIIGDDIFSHYIVVGDPIWQVKALQNLISPSEVLITWKCFQYTQDSRYEYEANREHRHYKIIGFKEQIKLIRQQYEATLNFQEMQRNLHKNMETNSTSNVLVENSPDANFLTSQNEQFALRSINEHLLSNETKKILRRFVIKPLLNAIDMNESIDSLTEMRNCVIVFANVIPAKTDSKNLIAITDKMYKKLSSIVHEYEGILNKVSLFDKDMMFLSIFGLRGFQHENDSEIGLRCAHEMYETIKGWSEVLKISIGVTTGKTYCGVVGHSLRREFSVISVTVNKAARLMMTYTNIVSCDQETLIQSRMNLKHFAQLPRRNLKGIRGNKPNYEFRDILDFDKLSLTVKENHQIYGRQELFQLLNSAITESIENFNCPKRSIKICHKSCFIIKSDSQEGKSIIINKLSRDYHEIDLKCIRLILNTKHSTMHFWIIKYLIMKIFVSENYEEIVRKKLAKFKIDEYFFLLNEILNTNFEQMHKLKMTDENVQTMQQLLVKILFKQSPHFWVVLIDDADFIDSMSMNFLNSIMESQTIYFILTIGKQQKKWTLQQKLFYRGGDVTLYCLKPIDKTFHKDIACQSINVSAIPIEFERFLQQKSNGNPGWIESCAKTLLYSGKLKIKSLTIMKALIDGMILKNDLIIHDEKQSNSRFFNIFHNAVDIARITAANQSDEMIDVAIIQNELTEKDYVVNYPSNKLMLYDSLSSHEQNVCKCASVLGAEFDRAILNYLLPNSNLRVIGKTITKLFQLKILYCASTKEKHDDTMWAIKNEVISCNCNNFEIIESCRDLPKYASCAHLTFHDEKFRKYIYDTLTEKQLKEYHKKCIIFLYRNNKNCSNCGSKSLEIIDEIKLNYHDGFMKLSSNHDKVKKRMLKELKVKVYDFDRLDCQKRLKIFPFVLNYLNYDFRLCKCDKIVTGLLTQISDHCQGKDMVVKKIYSDITLAELCLKSVNYPRAINLLESATNKLNNSIDAFEEKILFFTYLQGRILLLHGICAEKLEEKKEALSHYYDACRIYKISFPSKFNFKAKLKLWKLIHDLKSKKTYCQTLPITRIQTMIKQQGSIVLQKICEFYTREHNEKMAKLAAMWSLKEALECRNYTETIARCFRNLLQVSTYTFSIDSIVFNQVFKGLCYRNLNKESLEEICNLYITLMEYQIRRGEIKVAIKIGQYAKKISFQMSSKKFLVNLTPVLFYALLNSRQFQECCKLLQEFSYSTKRTNNVHASSWYYALCMDLILDAGNDSVVEYDACWKHNLEKLSFTNYDSYSEAYARFLTNLWLWNLRKENIDMYRLLMSNVLTYYNEEISLCNIFTGIRIIDGLNLQTLNSMRVNNWVEFQNLIEKTKIFLEKMKKIGKCYSCFDERLELCEIHFNMIKRLRLDFCRRNQLMRLFKRALKRSDMNTVHHAGRLILHSYKNHI